MITMLKSQEGQVPAISAPEVLSDTDDVKALRNAHSLRCLKS